MTVSILDLHCLNAVTDDYENVASILEEVRRTSHGNVSASELVIALEEMANAGLLTPYSLETRGEAFIAVNPVGKDLSSLWFRITPAGLAELEANWFDG
jgi:DNA-binding PadR family transcriptional regulator